MHENWSFWQRVSEIYLLDYSIRIHKTPIAALTRSSFRIFSYLLGPRFLNSGFWIGYFHDIYQLILYIIDDLKLQPKESEQKYWHLVYINETLRVRHNIKLDHDSKLVQNVLGAEDELEFHCNNGHSRYAVIVLISFQNLQYIT